MGKYWELKGQFSNLENQKLINEYLLYQKDTNKSKHTIITKRKTLQVIFKEREDHLSSLTTKNFYELVAKHQKEWTKDTLRIRLSNLRSFFLFCVQAGFLDKSPIIERKREITDLKNCSLSEENKKMVQVYLIHLKKSMRSEGTILNHRKSLKHFFKEQKDPFFSITPDDVQEWISKQQMHWRKTTLRFRLCILRSFFNFCVEEGYIEKSPVPGFRGNLDNKYWEANIPFSNLENQKAINEFLLSLKVINLSERTITGYRSILQRVFGEMREGYTLLTSENFQEWITRHQRNWKEGTLRAYLSVTNSFYNFCVEEGYLQKSIIKQQWYPRLPQPVPRFLEKEEVAKIRLQCEKELHRNRTMVEFLLSSGCRVGEIQKLNREEIDLENRTARVVGKGKKIRLVHFSDKTAILLERLLESRTDDEPALFISNRGNRLHKSSIGQIIKEIGEAAGCTNSLYPHRFRHTFATELLAKGADLSFISDELGHADLKTTKIYARLPKNDLISMYRKYMG